MKGNIGVHGNLFGGTMLAWLDEAGAAFACEKAQSTHMVTRLIDKVEFSRLPEIPKNLELEQTEVLIKVRNK